MTGSLRGRPQLRSEDAAFLTGEARYVEDIALDFEALHAVFVRSFMAHARIVGIEVDEARGRPGVEDVIVARDLDLATAGPGVEV